MTNGGARPRPRLLTGAQRQGAAMSLLNSDRSVPPRRISQRMQLILVLPGLPELRAGIAASVLAADPVTRTVGRSDVRLAGVVADLARADADALVATLNAHFAGDGLVFVAPRPDAFFVRATTRTRLAPPPPRAALGRPLHLLLPEGADADAWRRWHSEMEMLLHEHPVNLARGA